MLDDLKMIHERDAQDLLGIAGKQGEQLRFEYTLQGKGSISGIQNIVFGAMGGSALPAQFTQSWPSTKVPLEIARRYDVPSYVGENSLFIAASYSGNTEETLIALEEVQRRGAKIAVITNGGILRQIAEQNGYTLALLPQEFPRLTLWYSFRALLQILEQADVLYGDFRPDLNQVAQFINATVRAWLPDMATSKNVAKQIAQELMGKSIVVYSGPKFFPAAYKWKIGFNENAKQVSWVNQYPEFNHNEYTGWSKQPVDKPYVVIELRSALEHPRVQKRFEVTERLLSGMRPAPLTVQPEGDSLLKQLVWVAVLGDFVSIYLGLLNGLNPAPLELVDKFKHALA